MIFIIALFGLLIAGLSAWGLVAPRPMTDTVLKFWERPSGIYLAVGFRVVLGILFILAAPETRWPIVFEVLGWLMLAAAVLIMLLGKARLDKVIRWFTDMPLIAVRTWLAVGFVAGLLIFYGAT